MINRYELRYEYYKSGKLETQFTNYHKGNIHTLDEDMELKGYKKLANYYYKEKDNNLLKVQVIKHKVELNC